MASRSRRLQFAGLCSVLAGLAWTAWALLNLRTNGGFDKGVSAVGTLMVRMGQLLIILR